MITTNVYQRVFQLRFGGATSTCFAIEVDNKQYIVTAKHCVAGIENRATVQLYQDAQWKDFPVSLVGVANEPIDVAVLATDSRLAQFFPLEPSMGGIIWGQDVYFLGFPYGWRGDLGAMNGGYPMPFVKRALLSCIQQNDVNCLLLDGHNNPGFSGGPVVFKEPHLGKFKVAAIISGYRYASEPIFQGDEVLPLQYKYNTGIIVAYSINYAVELCKTNPIGVTVA